VNIDWPKPIALWAIAAKDFLHLPFKNICGNCLSELQQVSALLTSGVAKLQVALPNATQKYGRAAI
jgi:hypothetical protein